MGNFSPRAEKALQLAYVEAARLGHKTVGTEHILLGLVALGEGVAVEIFEKMGVDFKKISPDCLLFQRKSVFLQCLHAESGIKTAGKDHRKAFLWRCGTPYMEKAYITRFVLDSLKPEKFHFR